LVLLFFLWTLASTALTEGMPAVSWEYMTRFFKVILLFLFVVLIVDKKLHMDFFLWCVVLSVGFFGALEAIKYIGSGGGHKIEGFSGHVLGDRNELALAFVIALPICFYLFQEYGKQSKMLRLGMMGVMGLLVAAVIGTQSRGGFIAMLVLAAYFFVKSDHKIPLAVVGIILAGILSQFVSSEWTSRMDTIGTADSDESFMGRVVAWKLSFILAMDHPIFGGGFKALENFAIWQELSKDFFSYSFFYTGDALPDEAHPHAAHSVYFQVLGDHGFIGLAIYLAMMLSVFMMARSVAGRAKVHPELSWIARLATMLQLSVFAFCVGGAALSFAYFDLIFAIFGLVVVLDTRILPRAIATIKAR
jgi:probable O-glycosylation ligase (exosortase A-associated)